MTPVGPVRRPERDGRGADRRRRDGRHPHHTARHLLPPRRHRAASCDPVQRRFGDGDRAGWATRASDLDRLTSATVRIGAAIHSVRAVDPASVEVVGAWADGARRAAARHVSEQPAENEQCSPPTASHPTALLDRHGAARRALHRRARDPPHRRRHRALRCQPDRRCASARRPSATSPTASVRRGRCATPDRRSPSAPTRTP